MELVLFSSPPEAVLLVYNDDWIGTYRSLLKNHGSVDTVNLGQGRLKISVTDTLDTNRSLHQVTTMLSTSKNVLFPGYNQVLTTGADDPSL